jgi:nitrite reductase/ring-hydroxylating ferredoxin subunit
VPPQSSGKERATKHALVNSSALALFTAGWLRGKRRSGDAASLTLQGLGLAALSVGGWLGGTLVYRNQIGVDHRYANAGKWDERRADDRGRIELETGDLEVDQMKLLKADGRRVAVARTEQGYTAFQDRCTHKGGPLSDGTLICGTVQCPWHGSQFDVHTGKVKCGPAERDIETFEVKRSPGALRLVSGE